MNYLDIGEVIIWKLGSGLNFMIRKNKLEWSELSIPKPPDEDLLAWKRDYDAMLEENVNT